MSTLDIKNVSVYNFLEIANAKGLIEQYFKNIPNVDYEYFSISEEAEIAKSKEFSNLQNTINKKFSGK